MGQQEREWPYLECDVPILKKTKQQWHFEFRSKTVGRWSCIYKNGKNHKFISHIFYVFLKMHFKC